MNDFSDIENQLKALRPVPLRDNLVSRVEQAMVEPVSKISPASEILPPNVVRPNRLRIYWAAGFGLAAAAVLLILARVNVRPPETTSQQIAAVSPAAALPSKAARSSIPDTFVPAGATQVVYHRRDEGLLYAANYEQPVRKFRSITRETWQWRNPATGASLQVSYPSEQVELIPVSGQ
jgi:hypothetical protein